MLNHVFQTKHFNAPFIVRKLFLIIKASAENGERK